MVIPVLRCLIICALVTGLLAPKSTAVFAAFLPGWQTVVICNGETLSTITIDANGSPVEHVEEPVQHCVLADILDAGPNGLPFWQKIALTDTYRFRQKLHPAPDADILSRKWPSQAPPVRA